MDPCEDRGGWAGWLSDVQGPLEGGASASLERIASQVIDRAYLRRGDTVADLGAGTGLLTLKAARAVGPDGRVLAVDSSPACLDRLRLVARDADIANITPLNGSLEDLPIEAAACDAVVCRSSLAYSSDLHLAVAEIARVLAPGGRFSAFEPLLAEMEWGGASSLGASEPDFLEMERTLAEKRSSYSLDRASLRGAFEGAGFEGFMSLPVLFTINMAGESEEDVLRDYLHDLPEGLAASNVLKTVMDEARMMQAARAFARQAAAGTVRGWVWCMFVWGVRPA